jgi:hypothetical protein
MTKMPEMLSEIADVVSDTVVQTFNGMLEQSVVTATVRWPAAPEKDRVYVRVALASERARPASFCFTFDAQLLSLTAKTFYPGVAETSALREDIACAVSNIVGTKVKGCLNAHGYGFTMSIPVVVPVPSPDGGKGAEDTIHVHFAYNNPAGVQSGGVVVNFQMEELRA